MSRVAEVTEHAGGDAELVQADLRRPLGRREEAQAGTHQRGGRLGDPGIEPQPRLRRVGGPGEEVDHLPGGLWVGIGEAEGLPVEAGLVGDVVDRVGDVVNRNDVDLAALDADRRQPGRQHPAHLLQQLEAVIGAIDLVDLPGA